MTSSQGKEHATAGVVSNRSRLEGFLPAARWLSGYNRRQLSNDLIAGTIVAIMLVPQGMAYALLAGLPPQIGLYASVLPLILYGLFGSSPSLAVGPVAIVSLMVASSAGSLAEPGSELYLTIALSLALLTGVIQLGLGLLRAGFLVNFLSHPVLTGFTSAAALVIAASQLKSVLGFPIPRLSFPQLVVHVVANLRDTNPATLLLAASAVILLLIFRQRLGVWLAAWKWPQGWIMPLTRSGPFLIVVAGTLLVRWLQLDSRFAVAIVGEVPAGLPTPTLPPLDLSLWQSLLPSALAISLVGYMESISVAKSLASKRREKVDADQELVALGIANLGAAVTGGYPVTGGFSRSVVNFAAGATSGLASMVTAVLIAVTLLLLTPLFYFLPQAVLSAIIIVAVTTLIDIQSFVEVWRYNRADFLSMLITFAVVLVYGIEIGVLAGVVSALLLFIWRTSRPHIAVVGRLHGDIYRNVLRHPVETTPTVLAMRVDESLYFANSKYLEDTLLTMVAERQAVRYVVLIGTAINFIDASALETLENLQQQLADAGVELHLAAIKGPVMDRLQRVGFVEHLGRDRFHLTTHAAMLAVMPAPEECATPCDGSDDLQGTPQQESISPAAVSS